MTPALCFLQLRETIVSNVSGAQLTIVVPQRGIWGTAGIGGKNIDGCGRRQPGGSALRTLQHTGWERGEGLNGLCHRPVRTCRQLSASPPRVAPASSMAAPLAAGP